MRTLSFMSMCFLLPLGMKTSFFLTPGEKKDTHRMWGHNAGVNANGVAFRFLI